MVITTIMIIRFISKTAHCLLQHLKQKFCLSWKFAFGWRSDAITLIRFKNVAQKCHNTSDFAALIFNPKTLGRMRTLLVIPSWRTWTCYIRWSCQTYSPLGFHMLKSHIAWPFLLFVSSWLEADGGIEADCADSSMWTDRAAATCAKRWSDLGRDNKESPKGGWPSLSWTGRVACKIIVK